MFILRGLFFGDKGLRKNYERQMENLVSYARASLGEIPVLIGEIGIPFDVNAPRTDPKKVAPADVPRDEATQVKLLDALANAMEQAGVAGWAWWNYNPDASLEMGDYWNKEDFSVVCFQGKGGTHRGINGHADSDLSQEARMYEGGRALDALIRPYAVRVAGIPVSSKFTIKRDTASSNGWAWLWKLLGSKPPADAHHKRAEFEFKFCEGIKFREADKDAQAEAKATDSDSERQWTVLFIPQRHFSAPASSAASDGKDFHPDAKEYELNVRLSDGEYVYHKEVSCAAKRPYSSARDPV